LVDALPNIRRKGKHTMISEGFNIKALIDEQRMHRFYRYDGSLTTPPCYESVIWTVLQKPLKLSSNQLNAFRSLHTEKSNIMINTYRTIQPLGTRKLFRSFDSENIGDEAKEQLSKMENHGEYLSININMLVVLTSILILFV
jgi:carbonic anhydrase